MAFVIKKEKSYTWPITISEPTDGGQFNHQKVSIKFKMLSQDRINDIVKNDNEEDADILTEVLIGWDEGTFKDESGNDLAFNADNKELILSVPYVRNGLVKGFFDSISGKQFKRKN